MDNQVFRQKSMDRISSPEELNDYLKVTNPGVWTLLAAVVALLIGLFVWSFAGELKTTLPGTAQVRDGVASLVLTKASPKEITGEMPVTIGGKAGKLTQVDPTEGLQAEVDLPDGAYEAEVTVENIHPISFLLG